MRAITQIVMKIVPRVVAFTNSFTWVEPSVVIWGKLFIWVLFTGAI